MRHPTTLAMLACAVAVLGLAGPFDTMDLLPLPARLLYWAVLVVPCYSLGYLSSTLVSARMRDASYVVRIVLSGIVTGLGVSLIVLGINLAAFGWWPDLADLGPFLATVFAVSFIVTAVLGHLGRTTDRASDTPRPPAVLERLPLDKRGPLVALSVEDHYVRVTTTRGQEMVLMRLGDAMREVGDTPGAQVHRSHWVAFGQVRAADRSGDRAILTMSTGAEIPVSRANMPKIREAGLLPR